ncbi:hypothetical protein HY641_04035 [Candidatus Woesearchaeota archaeon]|nr:hypothetical protein [Candidatus Woesearchaeota archaeon]
MKQGTLVTESIVVVTIGLCVLLLLLYWSGTLFSNVTSGIPSQICKDSVLRAAALNTRYTDFGASIDCETDNIVVEDLTSKQAQEEAKIRIADTLTDCWDRFGKGTLNLFGGEGVYCHICSYVELTDHSAKLEGLNMYLHTGFMPGTTTTYASYLTAETTTPEVSRDALDAFRLSNQNDVIDPQAKDLYATVFYYVKGKDPHAEALNSLASGGYVLGTVVVGFVVVKVGAIVGAAVATYTGISTFVGWVTTGTANLAAMARVPTFYRISQGLLSFVNPVGVGGRAMVATSTVGLSSTAAYLNKNPYDHYASVWFVPLESERLQAMGCTELIRKGDSRPL